MHNKVWFDIYATNGYAVAQVLVDVWFFACVIAITYGNIVEYLSKRRRQ